MILITRKERFNAAHRLFHEEWDDTKNLEVFGKCSNPNWHGHNYELFVTVKGEPNKETGFVINLKVLSAIIKKRVIDKIDHKNINLDVDFMKGKIPTTELLAQSIWTELEQDIADEGAKLHGIRLYETENNYVDYFGKDSNHE